MVLCGSVNTEFVHFKCEILVKYLYSAAVCGDHPATEDRGARSKKNLSWIWNVNTKAAVSSVRVHHEMTALQKSLVHS